MKNFKNLLLLVILSVLTALIVGCGGKEKVSQTTVANAKDEIVFANFRDIRDLNPHNYAGEMYAQNMLYEGLVKISPTGEFEPSLAKSWEVSEDGKEYKFSLRQGVSFSDGEKFDAHAVKANFDAIMDNFARHGWLVSLQLLNNYEVLDDYTFVIRLSEPYFPLLTELGVIRPFRFISPKAFKDGGTKGGVAAYIGTGPYILKQNTVDQEAIFERNENYWGKKPAVKTVRVKVIPDPQTRALALEKGDLDLLFGKDLIDAETIEKFSNIKGFTVLSSAPLTTRMMVVNSTRGPLQDKTVRKALQHVFDKEAISKSIFNGLESPADRVLAETVPYVDIKLTPYEFSLEKAGKLLDEAGWTIGASGKREKDGKTLEMNINYNVNSVSEKSLSEYFQQQLSKIGITLNVVGEEEQSYRDRMKKGDFDIIFNIPWGTPYEPQSFFTGMTKPAVYGDWAAQQGMEGKKELDENIIAGVKSVTEEDRREYFGKVISKLHDEAIYIPITYERNKAIHQSNLKNVGFDVSAYGIPFENMSY